MKTQLIFSLLLLPAFASAQELLPYQNPDLSPTERAIDLCGRLTIEEKSVIMLDISEAVPRLGIKKFNWWSEALHGVANQGNVTGDQEPLRMAAAADIPDCSRAR